MFFLRINKILLSLLIFLILFFNSNSFNYLVINAAQVNNDSNSNYNQPTQITTIDPRCKDPANSLFDTPECARSRLGVNNINWGFGNVYDIDSTIAVGLNIFIAVIFITAFFFILRGIFNLAQSSDNPDKRSKAIQMIIIPLIAIVLLFISYPFVNGFVYNLTGRETPSTIIDCDKLPTNASQELKDKCRLIKN